MFHLRLCNFRRLINFQLSIKYCHKTNTNLFVMKFLFLLLKDTTKACNSRKAMNATLWSFPLNLKSLCIERTQLWRLHYCNCSTFAGIISDLLMQNSFHCFCTFRQLLTHRRRKFGKLRLTTTPRITRNFILGAFNSVECRLHALILSSWGQRPSSYYIHSESMHIKSNSCRLLFKDYRQ